VADTLTFEQIRDLLRGTPFKVLDCRRKGILKLPGSQLRIWMAQWMRENGMDEAWPSEETIAGDTKLDERTVRRNRKALKKKGWMVKECGRASDRYHTSTPGAKQVPIMRVDDPSKGDHPDNSVLLGGDERNFSETGKTGSSLDKTAPKAARTNLSPKASISFSGSGSGSTSQSKSGSSCIIGTPLRGEKAGLSVGRTETVTADPSLDSKPVTQKQESLPVSNGGAAAPSPTPAPPSPKFKVDKNGRRKLAPDGTPYPAYFDACASGNPGRTAWVYFHTPMEERVDKGTDRLSCLEWLCHGVSDDDLAPPCLNLPQRKLGDFYYCLDCLPYTDYDREQEKKMKAFNLDFSNAGIEARRKKFEEADRKHQDWMKMMRRASAASKAAPGSFLDRLTKEA
jgi:hypothetical protein